VTETAIIKFPILNVLKQLYILKSVFPLLLFKSPFDNSAGKVMGHARKLDGLNPTILLHFLHLVFP
jgi:hypothetical protein